MSCHPKPSIAHWAELLANYDSVLIPIPGTKNLADGPSRLPDYAQDILRDHHDAPVVGHYGITKTIKLLGGTSGSARLFRRRNVMGDTMRETPSKN